MTIASRSFSRLTLPHFIGAALSLFMAVSASAAPSAVGIGSSFSVGPSGNASYAIPIEVPPGPNAMQPSVAIQYNGGGNGAVGKGWGIAAGGAVTRCPKTFAQDGAAGQINFDADDRFCLNGQRLVLVTSGATYGDPDTEYRTALASNIRVFARGASSGDPIYFTAEDGAGQTTVYGPGDDPGNTYYSALLTDGGRTIMWSIRSVTDRFGNQMRYRYYKDDGFQYLIAISYGYNANTGVGATASRRVRFEHSLRYAAATPGSPPTTPPDMRDTYFKMSRYHAQRTAFLLRNIKTDVWDGSAWKEYKNYKLSYDTNGAVHASRLIEVEECSANDPGATPNEICKESSLTFHWKRNQWHFDSAYQPTTGTPLGPQLLSSGMGTNNGYFDVDEHPRSLGDFDGDGFLDVIGFTASGISVAKNRASNQSGANGTFNDHVPVLSAFGSGVAGGGWTSQGLYPRIIADINGDGKVDVIGFGSNGVDVALSDGSTFGGSGGWAISNQFSTNSNPPYLDSTRSPRFVQDVNGDGRPDIVGIRRNDTQQSLEYLIAFNTGAGNGNPGTGFTLQSSPTALAIGGGNAGEPLHMLDLNADGRSDLLHFHTNGVWVSLSNGSGFDAPTQWTAEFPSGGGSTPAKWSSETVYPRTMADVNGDGFPDIVAFGNRDVWVALNTGTDSFFPMTSWTQQYVVQNGFANSDKNPRNLVDVDGDGRADIVGFASNGVWVALSAGTHFENARVRGAFESNAGFSELMHPRMLADLNADGFVDILGFSENNLISSLAEVTPGDNVRVFDNGNGFWNLVSRKPMTDSSVYTKSTGATYPHQDVIAPLYFVDSVTTPSRGYLPTSKPTAGDVNTAISQGNTNTVQFTYEGMRVAMDGRGTTSFSKITSTDDTMNVRTETQYSQAAFPEFGVATDVNVYRKPTGSSIYSLHVSQSVSAYVPDVPVALTKRQHALYQVSQTSLTKDDTGTITSESTELWQNRDTYGFPGTVISYDGPTTGPVRVTTTTSTLQNTVSSSVWTMGQVTSKNTLVSVPSGAGSTSTYERRTDFSYLPSGAILRVTSDPTIPALSSYQESTYDDWGNELTSTSAGGVGTTAFGPWVSNRVFDTYGYGLLRTTNALGHVSEQEIDRANARIKLSRVKIGEPIGGPIWVTTTNYWDRLGRQSKIVSPTGVTKFLSYFSYSGGVNYPSAVHTITRVGSNTSDAKIGPESTTYLNVISEKIGTLTDGFSTASGSTGSVYSGSVIRNPNGTIQTAYDPFPVNGSALGYTTHAYDVLNRPVSVEVHIPNQAPTTGKTVTTYAYSVLASETIDGITSRINRTTKTSDRSYQNAGFSTIADTNEIGQLVRSFDGEGKTLINRYHANGQPDRVRIPAATHTDDWGSSYSSPEVITATMFDTRGRRTQLDEPNSGIWTYAYDAADRLITQVDPAGGSTAITYDDMGRKLSKVDGSANRTWSYDSCTNGIGKACQASVTGGVGYLSTMTYDTFGRATGSTTQIGLEIYTKSVAYDSLGRPQTMTYPGGFQIENHYASTRGNLESVSRTDTGATLWSATELDYTGLVTNALYGNGVSVHTTVDAYLRNVTSTKGRKNGVDIYGWNYGYHHWGALESRTETTLTGPDGYAHWQVFPNYDRNERLRGWYSSAVNGGASYDSLGNLRWKSDASTGGASGFYIYNATVTSPGGATRTIPNAVGEIRKNTDWSITSAFNYDQKAQMTASTARTMSWKSFGQPETVVKGAAQITLVYDASNQRVRQTKTISGVATITDYLNGSASGGLGFESELKNGIRENRHFISVGGQAIAIYKTFSGTGAPASSLQYRHSDKLSSTTAITNASGVIVERLSYDPWGKRQFIDGAADPSNTLSGVETDRGFTSHEHIDEVGLINMNGRMYDPYLARFISPDLIVEAPSATQSYNRFSYLMNSPLAGTDPTGYWSFGNFMRARFKFLSNPFRAKNMMALIRTNPGQTSIDNYVMSHPWARTTVMVAASYFGGPGGSAFASAYMVYISGGNTRDMMEAGGKAYATAYAFQAAGTIGEYYGAAAKVAAHAVVGCAAAKADGGHCGRGAASSAVSAAITVGTGEAGLDLDTRSMFAATVIGGGITSVIGGDSFDDGAGRAAIGFLFNECMHAGCDWSESPDKAPYEVFAEAYAGVAAYVVGKVTGDEFLSSVAAEGLGELRPEVVGAVIVMGTRGRGGVKLRPISGASGPHTTWKTGQTGKISRHETWTPNSRNPRGWDSVRSTDMIGKGHINKLSGKSVPTPHTQGRGIPGGVRPARPNEIPK